MEISTFEAHCFVAAGAVVVGYALATIINVSYRQQQRALKRVIVKQLAMDLATEISEMSMHKSKEAIRAHWMELTTEEPTLAKFLTERDLYDIAVQADRINEAK